MGKRIYIFYLKNYEGVHHIISLFLFVFIFMIGGMTDLLKLFPFQLFVLVCNYFVTKYSLRVTKIHELVQQELKELEKENNKS